LISVTLRCIEGAVRARFALLGFNGRVQFEKNKTLPVIGAKNTKRKQREWQL
jgi:cell division protein FtsN